MQGAKMDHHSTENENYKLVFVEKNKE